MLAVLLGLLDVETAAEGACGVWRPRARMSTPLPVLFCLWGADGPFHRFRRVMWVQIGSKGDRTLSRTEY